MLNEIDHEAFTDAIRQSYASITDTVAANLASSLIDELDPRLEPAVSAWIEGSEVPDISAGKYSVNTILTIRRGSDYLEAFRLLSSYMADPAQGEKDIWRPVGTRPWGGV